LGSYQYKARDKAGKLKQGIIGADSQKIVSAKLEQMGYIPISITSARSGQDLNKFFSKLKRIKFTEISLFTRLLATLQKAGLPLLSSLNALREQTVNKQLCEVIDHITKGVKRLRKI